ncbi:hypothetical protein [Lysobacter auxotrophicus]|uniref:Secreted protein n=1 Tax=Lysobacter auxotrophicus TaxID=2992573 RepID=A0ABN6UPG1_9GAMM|nr:hypothetical protein [Lysobacter auxotrophicus]BDU18293.1 hypothetical protein LA521A_34940 [Lysobacter auxotrophicus]
MKQLLLAAMSLAGLFAPGFAFAQYDCFLVCTPARVYCQPSGVPMPPLAKLCGVTPLKLSLDTTDATDAQSPPPACAAQQVFDEDTQTYEWQMVCD